MTGDRWRKNARYWDDRGDSSKRYWRRWRRRKEKNAVQLNGKGQER